MSTAGDVNVKFGADVSEVVAAVDKLNGEYPDLTAVAWFTHGGWSNEAMAEADGLMTEGEWISFIESFNRWLDEVDCYAYEDRYE